MQSAKPRLSLSMIIKNEEKFLDGCLASVKEVADEIVIVDTGSTDASKMIAARFGAKTVEYRWAGDFSAARNVALAHCTGEWVLSLDADERLAQGQSELLEKMLSESAVSAFAVRIDSSFQRGAVQQSNYYPRLFRRLPGVRFEGIIHEQVIPSLQRLNISIIPSKLVIEHLGYDGGSEVLGKKSARNVELLTKHLEIHSTDAYARFQLGNSYALMKEYDRARTELQKAVADQTLSSSCKAVAYNLLADVEAKTGNQIEAESYCARSLEIVPEQVMANWFLALSLLDRQKFSEAIPFLQKLDAFINITREDHSTQIAADLNLKREEVRLKLALAYEQQGKVREAMAVYAQTMELKVDSDSAAVGYLRCAEAIGGPRAPFTTPRSSNGKFSDSASGFMQAWQCHNLHDDNGAFDALNRLLQTNGRNVRAFVLSIRWRLETGETVEAERLLAQADANNLRNFELHKCGLDVSLKKGDLNSAMKYLEMMAETTDADLSPLKSRIASLAARLSSQNVAAL